MPHIKYKQLRAAGRYGNARQISWIGTTRYGRHSCCGSEIVWYHRKKCPGIGEQKFIAERKAQGKTTAEVAKELGMPLSKINKAWAR